MIDVQENILKQLQSIKFIYWSLLAGILFFFAVAVFITERKETEVYDYSQTMIFIIPPVVFVLALLGRIIYDKRRKKSFDSTLEDKANSFIKDNIVKYAIWEGAAIMSLISFIISAGYFYLILFAGIVLLFLINVPTKNRFGYDYKLTSQEIEKLFSK